MPATPRSNRSLLTLALVLAPMGAVTACSRYRPPSIRIVDAAVTERTDEAVRIELALDLENLNDESMQLRRFTYRFDVAGRPTFRGLRAGEATLRPNGSKRLLLPAVVVTSDGEPLEGPIAWSIRGELIYTTPGELAEILLDTGVRKPTARFEGRGVVEGE